MDSDLLTQADALAERLGISRADLIERALAAFIAEHEPLPDAGGAGRSIHQGDVVWWGAPDAIPHPHVVVQPDVLNRSRIETVVVCALTSNLKRAALPGNVLLDAGEANLPRPSVIEVSKVSTVRKADLGAHLGTLSAARVDAILAGMRFLQRSFFEGDT